MRNLIRLAFLCLVFIGVQPALADELDKAAGTWSISSSSKIRFSVAQVGGGGIAGTFSSFSGKFRIDKDVTRSGVTFQLKAASVEAGDARITAFIRSDAVFDAERNPVISFKSTRVTRTGDNEAKIEGQLTARGITRTVAFQATFDGQSGNQIRFRVTGKMSRALFGMEIGTPIYSNSVVFDMEMKGVRG